MNLYETMQTRRRAGRPFDISDSDLKHRQWTLLKVFQPYWASFAYDLELARTAKQVRQALLNIRPEARGDLALFLSPKTLPSTLDELKRVRQSCHDLENGLHSALEQERQAAERLANLESAIAQDAQSARYRPYLADVKERHQRERQSREGIQSRLDALRVTLEAQSAYVAQDELIGFIGNTRYSYSPQSLADPMAGATFIHWRRSITRCRALPVTAPFPLEYEKFCVVHMALAGIPVKRQKVLEAMEAHLLKRSLRKDAATSELRREWYYLREAISMACKEKIRPGELPFRVYDRYMERTSARSRGDLVLAEMYALTK
jgi:hypothetical protein